MALQTVIVVGHSYIKRMQKVVKSETYANFGFVIKYITLYTIVGNLSNIIRHINSLKPAEKTTWWNVEERSH